MSAAWCPPWGRRGGGLWRCRPRRARPVVSLVVASEGTTGENPLGLGLVFTKEAPGLVARFEPKAHHRGPPGFLHGGIAATVLDETMASVGWALDDVPCVTATLELKYRKPV